LKRYARKICFFILAAFVMCILCACKKNENQKTTEAAAKAEVTIQTDTTLNLCIYNTDTLNPLTTSVKHNAEVLSLLYDSLFTISSSFDATPNLAEGFSVSDDGRTVTVPVRSGIKFQDGTRLTADDVAASVNTILTSNGYYKSKLSMITHAKAKGNGVKLYLTKPTANLSVLLDFPILPNGGKKYEDEKNMVLKSVIPGSGIYALTDYTINKTLHLSAKQNHHSGNVPLVQNINIHLASDRKTAVYMLENSKIDMLAGYAVNIESYTPKKELLNLSYNGLRFVFLGMNSEKDGVLSKKVLSAISAGINRNEFLAKLGINGVPALLPIHPDSSLYGEDAALFDIGPAGARATLLADGWLDTDNDGVLEKKDAGKTHTLSLRLLVCSDNSAKGKLSELLKKSLSELGVEIKIESVPFKTYQSRISAGDYDLFLGETQMLPNFDLDDIIKLSHKVTLSKDLSAAIFKTKRATNTSAQQELYREALALYASDAFIAGLYFKNECVLADESIGAKNIVTTNPYQSISTWY